MDLVLVWRTLHRTATRKLCAEAHHLAEIWRLPSHGGSAELQIPRLSRSSRGPVSTRVIECSRSQIPPFPWASTSFRPRHIRSTAVASEPPSPSIAPRAAAATAGCSVSTRRSPRAKPPGSLQSRRAGCRHAWRTLRSVDLSCRRRPLALTVEGSSRGSPGSTFHLRAPRPPSFRKAPHELQNLCGQPALFRDR